MNSDLAKAIRENPGATLTLDNDCWWLDSPSGEHLVKGHEPPERELLWTLAEMAKLSVQMC